MSVIPIPPSTVKPSRRALGLLLLCCTGAVLSPNHSNTKTPPNVPLASASSPPWLFTAHRHLHSSAARATSHGFHGVSDDSALAKTMIGSDRDGDPYELEAPGADAPLRLSHGTTTVALLFEGGVIAAVDSRASMGSFVGSRTTQKVIPVSDHILGTMAGGAADCTFWLRYLGMQASVFEARNNRPMPVATAARVLADTLMGQRGRGLSVGTMVMGHDRGRAGAAELYYVDSEGARVKGKYFSVGSGSTYAYSVLDNGYRPDLTLEEAADLARKAVRHATYRDAFSGGFINVFVVDSSGWKKITTDDAGFMEVRHNGQNVDDDEPTNRPSIERSAGRGNHVAVGGEGNEPTAIDGLETVEREDDGAESGGHEDSR